jgi:hypothetical protein
VATIHPGVTGRKAKKQLAALAVSPRQACILLDCGITHLYDLIGSGELESYLDGRSRKITMRSIHARHEHLLATARAHGAAVDVTPHIAQLFAHKELCINNDILTLLGEVDQSHPDLRYHDFYRALVLLHTAMDVEGRK